MENTALAWLFDIDGVLTDLHAKKVVEEKLFAELLMILKKGQLVCLNSGRSLPWIEDKVINPLQQKADDKTVFTNLFIVGEKGGIIAHFDHEGVLQKTQDRTKFLPSVLTMQVKKLVEEKYSDSMFFDPDKDTMISVEMQDDHLLSLFHKKQKEIVIDLQQLLADLGYDKLYKVDPSNISTDIERVEVGKGLGTLLFLQFLDSKEIVPDKFVTFGDSKSDFEMSDILWDNNDEVEMVYVGDQEKLGPIARRYEITFIDGYSRAVLAYLQG
jgi:hydroxymethylpyrimidine pyrophosphatase-like HAD family hydrolase